MWKKMKKNEIVIYAIALMLVTAGYFNYSTNIGNATSEIYSEDIENIAKTDTNENANENDLIENTENNQVSQSEDNNNDEENIGAVTLVNSNDVLENDTEEDSSKVDGEEAEEDDYFVSSKLERDTNYATMISNYTKILEDSSVNDAQKSIAMNEITKINNTKNAIAICENLLKTKGFENSLVLVNNKSINVVVKVDEELKIEMVAQIQNIISRELDAEIENIHIAEK